jgi:hypothetical protein
MDNQDIDNQPVPSGETRPIPTKNGNCKITITNPNAKGGTLILNPNGLAQNYPYNAACATVYNNKPFTGADVEGLNQADPGDPIDVVISLMVN